ncbi:MAG: DUF4157 domain-containing protein [Salinibacter sp.]|uniref:eCIS core domain-containing protein n=1 Tax=Salinibacter sp. TaxID=2065818 RepID=UPI002FC3DECA
MCPRCRRRVRQGRPLDCPGCEAELRRKGDGPGGEETELRKQPGTGGQGTAVRRAVDVTSGPGRPLSDRARSFFEAQMGAKFGDVRIHMGGEADRAARAIGARAYTLNNDIVVRSSEHRPETREGRRLLAHELTHVLQQRGQRGDLREGSSSEGETVRPQIQRQDGANGEAIPDDGRAPEDEGKPGQKGEPKQKGEQTNQESGEKEEAKTASVRVASIGGGEANCVETVGRGESRTSVEPFTVAYTMPSPMKSAQVLLLERGTGPVQSKTVTEARGEVTFEKGISISENARYLVRMKMKRKNGSETWAQSNPPVVKFQLCKLPAAPTGVDLKFAKMVYAEAGTTGEFPMVRDLVYNRIQHVKRCPKDESSFGEPTIDGILTHEKQFESVLQQSRKFKELESELNDHSGPCGYTTSPRSTDPSKCYQINKAIEAIKQGDRGTHDYLFFRSDTDKPSDRAHSRFDHSGGNHYWKIRGCPGGEEAEGDGD